MRKSSRRRSHKPLLAFTLIELLVVISVIALLLSILMPSLQKAKAKAQQVVCMTNLRQVGMALVSYTSDNGGSFHRGYGGWSNGETPVDGWAHWIGGLLPYRGGDIKSLVCPSAKVVNPTYSSGNYYGQKNYAAAWVFPLQGGFENVSLTNPAPLGYTMSTWVTNPDSTSVIATTNRNPSGLLTPYEYCWKRYESVRQAASVPMFGDGKWLEAKPMSPTSSRGSTAVPPGAIIPPSSEQDAEYLRGADLNYSWGLGQYCMRRHSGSVDLVFADLNARKVNLTDLWGLKWYRSFNVSNDYANGTKVFPEWVSRQ